MLHQKVTERPACGERSPEETERVEFIRRAAIALCASDAPGPDAAWLGAQRLWDAKPDEC